MHRLLLPVFLALSIAAPALVAEASAPKPYALSTCIVSGEHLTGGDLVVYVHKETGKPDRIMHFCCRKCLAKFKADPAKYLEKLDQAAAKPAPKG